VKQTATPIVERSDAGAGHEAAPPCGYWAPRHSGGLDPGAVGRFRKPQGCKGAEWSSIQGFFRKKSRQKT